MTITEMSQTSWFFQVFVLTGLNYKEIYVVGNSKEWPLTVLTGDRINGIFYRRMYDHFAGPKNRGGQKKGGRNNEVIVLTGWPYGGVSL